MKKKLLSIMTLIATGVAFGQTIPNGGFENWTTTNFEDPQFWACSNDESHSGNYAPINAVKTTDAYHGTYAIKITTVANNTDTAGGYFAQGNPGNGLSGGIPYNQTPTGMRLYYKANIMPGDSALVLAIFKNSGNTIGQYIYKISTSQSSYTLFNQTFSPALPMTPDTVIFACAAGNLMVNKGIPGTMLQVDSISFTGVANQPANFNGDFELWQNNTKNSLIGWNTQLPIKSTNKYSGNYALELVTSPPDFGNNQAQSARCTNATNHNGPPSGGSPYTTQIDTLVFYYKYLPANYPVSTDSARFFLSFYKNGLNLGGSYKLLPFSLTYKKVEVPFNLSTAPDTIQISFESSNWPMQNSYIGSDLTVDQLYLKSQAVPASDFIMPSTGCKGVPIQLADNSTNMPTSWQWFMTNSTPSNNSNLQNPIITYTNIGTFTVSLQAADSFGMGSYVSKVITIYNNPVVSVNSTTICAGNTATLTANGASTYTWNTSVTGSVYTVSPLATTGFTVVGTSTVGCKGTASSNVKVLIAPTPDICMVTVDSLSINNIVYWDKTAYGNVDSFIVYREIQTAPSIYTRIGAQPYNSLSQFIDTTRHVGGLVNGDPNGGSYRYKLQTLDTCGNYSALGPYHNTIYIQHNSSGVFSWATPYSIENQSSPVTNYVLFCDTANTNVWTAIQSVAGNQQQVADAGYNHHSSIANWRVDANGFNCNPTLRLTNGNNGTMAAKVRSHSNQNNNRVSGIKQTSGTNQATIYPNPANNILNIGFAVTTNKVAVKITSLLGSEVYNNTQSLSGSNLSIDISNLANGTYLVQITTDTINEIKKIVKQ
jgi:hypothetical protein